MNLKPTKQQMLRLLPDKIVQTRGSRAGQTRYLSFDDGPHPEHTPRLLDLLAEHDVHASFFVVGQRAESHPAIVERIVAEGHLLGNHSWSHTHFARIPLLEQVAELDRTDDLLRAFDQRPRHRVRPPQGSMPLPLLLYLARHRRSVAYWSYDSLDYREQPASELTARLLRRPPRPGDIVLMHDDNVRATEALAALLPQWRSCGHTFDALAPERA